MALTKMDLIEQVSTELGFLRNQSAEIVQSVIEIVKSSLASGEDVLVSGFGKFCVKDKRERAVVSARAGIPPNRIGQYPRPTSLRCNFAGPAVCSSDGW
jgi:nucleoid DNA-binding protein